jgi:hypothetical protein
MRIWHSGPGIGKNLNDLKKIFPMDIFSNLIKGKMLKEKGKMTQEIRFWGQNPLKK